MNEEHAIRVSKCIDDGKKSQLTIANTLIVNFIHFVTEKCLHFVKKSTLLIETLIVNKIHIQTFHVTQTVHHLIFSHCKNQFDRVNCQVFGFFEYTKRNIFIPTTHLDKNSSTGQMFVYYTKFHVSYTFAVTLIFTETLV